MTESKVLWFIGIAAVLTLVSAVLGTTAGPPDAGAQLSILVVAAGIASIVSYWIVYRTAIID